MFPGRGGFNQEKQALTFDSDIPTTQSWTPSRKAPRYYTPFTARTPWLATILVAVLACVAVLETAVQTGDRGGRRDDSINLSKRWLKRQDLTASSGTLITSSAIIATSTYTGSLGTSGETESTVSAAVESPLSTSSDVYVDGQPSADYIAISTTSEEPIEAPTLTTDGGYISISTSSSSSSSTSSKESATLAYTTDGGYISITTTSESVMYDKPTSDFITLSTSSTVYADGQPSATYIAILTTITSDGTEVPVVPATYTSAGQEYTSYETIGTDKVSAASAAQSVYQSITEAITEGIQEIPTQTLSTIIFTTTLEDGGLQTVTKTSAAPISTPSVPGQVKASQIQIGSRFTKMDYFSASYLGVLIAVVLKTIWAMVFASLKMMEPFYHLARPEGATAKDSLLNDFLSTGYSVNHIKHIFGGHWVMLSCTIAYLGFAFLPPLATQTSTVVATAYCTSPKGDQIPCNPVWVLNVSFVRGLEAVLCLIALLIIVIIFLSWPRKSGIFANPSSIASMASLLSHEETLNDLRQIDQVFSDEQIAHTLDNNHYTFKSYEVAPDSGLYRYGICKTVSSSNSNPYSLDRFRNFDNQSRTHYSALQNPSASDYSLPASFPAPMGVYPKTSPINTSATPFSLPKRTVRDVIFLFFLLALLGVIIAYYFDGSGSGFNDFFNSDTFGPGFILSGAAVAIDFHFKTLEREVRILVPYRNLGARMAKSETSVLMNIGGTAWGNFPKACWRGEWFHALIAGTAVLSDFLIVAVAGVPYANSQVWQAFLVSTYLSMGVLGIMVMSVFGIFWWRGSIKKLKLPREPDTLLSVWLMLCDEGNQVRKEFDGWETTGERERDRACRGRGAKYQGGWVLDDRSSGRYTWSVGVDGRGRDGMVVGYG